jgi:hypothetical protein
MPQKIKSITVIKEYPSVKAGLKLKIYQDSAGIELDNGICMPLIKLEDLDKYPEYFEIEYETPKLLKRDDCSLISEPKEGEKIVGISLKDFSISANFWSRYNDLSWSIAGIKQGLIFLEEDTDLAEKKAEQLTKQLEIQNEIDRLNALEGAEVIKNFKLQYIRSANLEKAGENFVGVGYKEVNLRYIDRNKLMSLETVLTILAKYDQEDLKAYLNL